MSDYFNCKLCDKSTKIKSKKKHSNSQYLKFLSMSILSRYSVTNPDFLHIENIFKNSVLDYNEKLAFYLIIYKWKVHFSDTNISVESNTWYSVSAGYYLRNFLSSKNKYFERYGRKFSHISEVNPTFIPDLRNMTYEHYVVNQPKSSLEWKLNVLLAKNPELIKILGNNSHLIFGKYQFINEDDGEN